MKHSNKYIYIFLFLLIVTGILFYVNSQIAFNKIENIKQEKYALKAQSINDRVDSLINNKKNSTLSLALMIAEDKSVKEVLKSKKPPKDLEKLYTNSLKLREFSDFKNVWFQIIDQHGVSQYRSWVKKRGDSVLNIRLDVVKMLKNPQIMSTISTGKFDMTFKSMVPIFDQGKFIGIAEVITHFNSIAKKFIEAGIDPVILVDKRYKKQLTKPFTKLFVNDYYVANYNAKPELLEYIKHYTPEYFIEKENEDYILQDNYFISFFKLPDIENQPMGHFLFFQDIDAVDFTEIESFKLVSKIIILTLTAFFVFGIVLILFLARKNKIEALNKSLEAYNQQLQTKIEEEILKNKKQNILLQKQNRLVALGEMLENIAHQWRQPLSAISTCASGLQLKTACNEPLSEEELHEQLEYIISTTQHLSTTIDDFRNFFQKDNQKQHFNVAQTIKSSFNIVHALYTSKGIEIYFDMDESLYYDGYRSEFSQVMINLFNNAKDALENQIKLKDKVVFVTVKMSNNNMIEISIKDNAGGIPKEIQEKIFDPYFTTKHQSKGTGIGLYMCQEIIYDHFQGEITTQNHTVSYKNQTYKGAKFLIKLPL